MNNFNRAFSRKSSGFTLIELLVALVILGLLMSVVGPSVLKYVGGAKTDTGKMQIENMSAALDNYYLEMGRYPSQDQGLNALVEAPSGAPGWNGPYMKKKAIPTDPWGADYIYLYPGENGPFDLYSLGADSQEGGEKENADIVSWE